MPQIVEEVVHVPVTQTQARPRLSDSGGVEGLFPSDMRPAVKGRCWCTEDAPAPPNQDRASLRMLQTTRLLRLWGRGICPSAANALAGTWFLSLRPPPCARRAAGGNSRADDAGADRACAQGRPALEAQDFWACRS